jgi:small subunit ribosomal protein S9
MADEEQQDEGAEPEEPQGDAPAAEETPAGASDEVAEGADQGVPEAEATPADTGSKAEGVGGAVQDADADAPAEETPAETPKAKDQAPGADLEPIALEPERELSAEERARAEAEAEERARAEAEAEGDVVADEPVAREAVKLAPDASVQTTGKRKSAIARVVVRSGSGAFEINSRQLEEYFPRHQHQTMVRQPLVTAGYESTVDVRVRVHGGGVGGQAGAVRHGIARALTEIDPELRGELKRRGFLTRDAREKERRKAGLKKARKRPQFSKR